MNKFVRFAFCVLILPAIGYAQSSPAIDLFGGYSYLKLQVPESAVTNSQSFSLNGYDASFSIGLFHHLAIEADISGHQVTDCGGVSDLKCSDFSYMFGPRFTIGDHSKKITAFVHGLVGQDRGNLLGLNSQTFTDTSIAVAGGAGADYWFSRHVGVQLGPLDVFYSNHLNNDGASGQVTYRAAAGVGFRFGGDLPPGQPKAPPQQAEAKPKTHRSLLRPWHKTVEPPAEGEPTTTTTTTTTVPPATAPAKTRSAQPSAAMTSRGMQIRSLGVIVAPQEFDGARILSIDPGSVAEMAAFHVGDLIKSVDGKAVRTPMELAAELSDKVGKVRITIQRGTFATETEILLGAH